jgi:hypothetical protein
MELEWRCADCGDLIEDGDLIESRDSIFHIECLEAE